MYKREYKISYTVDAIVEGTTDQPIKLEVWGALEANAPEITTDPFSVSNRTFTDSMVSWEPGPSVAEGDAGENEATPDISGIKQEIIDLDGWASGNNMMLIVTTGDTLDIADKNREMESADGDVNGAPVLNVTFTTVGGGTGVNSIPAGYSSLIYPNPTEGKLFCLSEQGLSSNRISKGIRFQELFPLHIECTHPAYYLSKG